MFSTEELLRRLKPILGKQTDSFWNSFLVSDDAERKLLQQVLEIKHAQGVDDFQDKKIILAPPSTFGELYGEYSLGMVVYAGKLLYPFALLERELTQHIGVFGRTGAGKSYFVRGLLQTHLKYHRPVFIFDWKGTYTDLPGVLVFVPGSKNSSFQFNPLNVQGIEPEQQKAYLRQVIDIFIDSYLPDLQLLTVHGVESLLLLALDNLIIRGGVVTFPGILDFLKTLSPL